MGFYTSLIPSILEGLRSEATSSLYLLTIHKHQVKDFVLVSDILDVLEVITSNKLSQLRVLDIAFESHGMYRQLHCHMIVRVNKEWRYRGYTSIGGYRCHWESMEIDDFHTVHGYIHKRAENLVIQEQILDENNYRKHYAF